MNTLERETWQIGHEIGAQFAQDLQQGGGRTTPIIAAQQQLSADTFKVWLHGFGAGVSSEAGTPAGWHVTTCGWCGGEAAHEDNCKNDT